MDKDNTDETQRATRVAGKQFLDFASVESDSNASSVNWLRARLAEMAETLRSGGSLSVYESATATLVTLRSVHELSEWANRHFPVAKFKP